MEKAWMTEFNEGRPPSNVADTPDGSGDRTPPAPLSLMITNRQRLELKARGFSDADIREMTPGEAHKQLGL
jgi:hypothetical protein